MPAVLFDYQGTATVSLLIQKESQGKDSVTKRGKIDQFCHFKTNTNLAGILSSAAESGAEHVIGENGTATANGAHPPVARLHFDEANVDLLQHVVTVRGVCAGIRRLV